MEKGVLILFITFGIIAIIHFVTLKFISLSEKRKIKIRKIYWYIYGIYFLGYGLYHVFALGFNITGLVFIFFAMVLIIMNAIDKIETKNPKT